MAGNTDHLIGYANQLAQKADEVIVVSDLVTIMGFCELGTENSAQAKWSICKVEQNQLEKPYRVSIRWANGRQMKDLILDNWAGYDYSVYRTF